jgi:hypothetical protein
MNAFTQQPSVPLVDEKLNKELLKNFSVFLKLFDALFTEIQPPVLPDEGGGAKIQLSRELLTPEQVQCLFEMSGYNRAIYSLLRENQANLFRDKNPFIKEIFAKTEFEFPQAESHAFLQKKVDLLKDYLVREIDRNEELENRVKQLEEEAVIAAAKYSSLERRSKRKEGNNNNDEALPLKVAGTGILNQSSDSFLSIESEENNHESTEEAVPTTKTTKPNSRKRPPQQSANDTDKPSKKVKKITDPLSLVGQFLRKKFGKIHFFGLIVSYEPIEKWFRVSIFSPNFILSICYY